MAIRLAFIGAGQISTAHLNGVHRLNQVLKREETIQISAVVDTFPDRAGEWVNRNFSSVHPSQRPQTMGDWRGLLLGSNKPDMVSILLPPHLHLEAAKPFLAAGVAVQMQKPIGLGIRDGRMLVEISQKTGTPLTICEPSVLGRPARLLLEWVKSGRQIGSPTFMIDQSVIDLKGGFFMTPWRHLKGVAGGGWMLDHGIHRAHWMLEAFGPCESAMAMTKQIEPERQNARWGKLQVDTEDCAAAVLRFKNGVICQFSAVSGGRGQAHHHIQIWGTRGNYCKDRCNLTTEPDPRDLDLDPRSVAGDVPIDPFAHSYLDLIKRLRDKNHTMICEPARALEAEAIIYACMESAHTGRMVMVDDVLAGKVGEYEQTVWNARETLGIEMGRLT